ncbi:MAG: 4-hydroxy-tetrahydrodipicolinate synthase [Prevotellaceae bacterium]|jgi:4-hydroxy-tetrahydrodipicolinate synthase|nr:4-hydroxy-tetrahydrodipicolinate synthase [Prevotellaceae bacterium]
MRSKFSGVGVALVTPFDNYGNVDYPALTKLVDHVVKGGVDYLVALGTTAETSTLNAEEQANVLEHIKQRNAGRLPVILGLGGNNTAEVKAKVEQANFSGVDALLSVTPYYNKPSQQGLYEHYKVVAETSPVPVLLYNVPGRTGVNLTSAATLKLAHEVKNVCGIKEASGNIAQAGYILRDAPKDFLVISGDDNLALPLMSIGAVGVISVAANAFPKQMSDLVKAVQSNKYAAAATVYVQMLEIVDALFVEGNPVGVKGALSILGVVKNNLRLPLVSASDALMGSLKKLMAKL